MLLLELKRLESNLLRYVTDTLNNNKGEVKFILEESGEVTYYIYYDKTENGTKTALADSYVINGNFEHSSGTTPTAWNLGQSNIGTNAPNNEVHPLASEGTTVVADGATADNTAHTGKYFHIHGYRDRDESGANKELVYLEKTFSVPSSSSGNLTYWFRVQAFDDLNYDYLQVTVNGTVINQNNLNIVNGVLAITSTKYGRSSAYGGYVDAGWTKATLDLSTYAGSTITIRIAHYFASDDSYRSWQLVDDMEWSLNTAITTSTQEVPPTAILNITKNSCVISDPINGTNNPKRIAGATIRYAMEVSNSGGAEATDVIATDNIDGSFDTSTIQNLQITSGACDCLGVASASNNGTNGSANGVTPVKLDFTNILGGTATNPTLKCGYFEVEVD